jgi:hypothetical protein
METDEALVVVQESVLETLGWTAEGDALNEEIVGYVLFGVTLFEEEELAEVPARFVAVTTNVYACPFVRLGTTMGLPEEEAAMLLGLETAV